MNQILSSPCFVIHLPKNKERLSVYHKLVNAGYQQIHLFEGVNGSQTSSVRLALARLRQPPIDPKISTGALGCLLSHLTLLQKIVYEKISIATIFEDDILFHPQWKELSEYYLSITPEDYEVLFIGNQLDSCRMGISTPEITKEPLYCTHAYVVTLEGAHKLLDQLLHWNYQNTPYQGLTIVDLMIKHIQMKEDQENPPFKWYAWNGTHYPCEHNKLPISLEQCRNTGLVFQDTRLPTTVQGTHTFHEKNDYNFSDSVRPIQKPLRFT
jgi:glycosyl transferase family 25